MGSGTTLVEAKLLNRHAVGVDINPQSVSISETNLQFQCESKSKIFTRNGNATDLHFIKDNQIDFICTHPPYANIIKYSKGIEGDISLLAVDEFLSEMKKVAEESFRVLKKGKMCAVMIGDVKKYGKVIPLGFRMMECFLQAGFVNKEIIIKETNELFKNKKIKAIEYLYNFNDSPDYVYVDFENEGYIIYQRDTLEMLEYSDYYNLNYSSNSSKKYYAGPSNYYEEREDELVDIQTGNHLKISNLDLKAYADDLQCFFSQNKNAKIKVKKSK